MKLAILASATVLVAASTAFTFLDRPAEGLDDSSTVATAAISEALAPAPPAMWRRPAGPLRVALQAGHWRATEAPDEQAGLRNNGTRGGGKHEWEVNLDIAQRAAAMLEAYDYVVEVLPTTIPPGYWADLFISIHADGSASTSTSGFRAAAPRRDATGRAEEFVRLLERTYGEATGLRYYPEVTRRMRGYYAFNYRRYQHALHPMTTGVIIETGFLTSPRDRAVIVNEPDRAARGIAEAARLYLETTDIDVELAMPPIAVPRPPALRRSGD